MQLAKVQLSKAMISPWGVHGNLTEVDKNGVTAIETADGTPHICVTVTGKDGVTRRHLFREWDQSDVAAGEGLACEHCGKAFENSQGLAGHKRFCSAPRKE